MNRSFRIVFGFGSAVTELMRMLDTLKSVPLALAVLLLAPMHALAVPEFMVLVSVGTVAGGGGSDSQTTGVLVNTLSASLGSNSLAPVAGSTATASAFATPGTLGAFASARSGSSSFGGATASATTAFSDTLTFSGPATVFFNLGVGGFLDGCFSCPSQGNVSSTFTIVDLTGTGIFVDDRPSVTFGRAFIGGTVNLSPAPALQSIELTTTIGGEISLRGSLGVFTGADGLGSFGIASYGRTANFYVDVLTPDVTYISASGLNYATPRISAVPAPSTGWLLLSGLLLLLLDVGRRQRKRTPAQALAGLAWNRRNGSTGVERSTPGSGLEFILVRAKS